MKPRQWMKPSPFSLAGRASGCSKAVACTFFMIVVFWWATSPTTAEPGAAGGKPPACALTGWRFGIMMDAGAPAAASTQQNAAAARSAICLLRTIEALVDGACAFTAMCVSGR
jgi:hypothetical protein